MLGTAIQRHCRSCWERRLPACCDRPRRCACLALNTDRRRDRPCTTSKLDRDTTSIVLLVRYGDPGPLIPHSVFPAAVGIGTFMRHDGLPPWEQAPSTANSAAVQRLIEQGVYFMPISGKDSRDLRHLDSDPPTHTHTPPHSFPPSPPIPPLPPHIPPLPPPPVPCSARLNRRSPS